MFQKSQQLQAAYARRRELESMRVERTQAVSRYYDHWGKVTTRYQNWTAPDYYKHAEEQLRQTKEKKERKDKLIERQKKLQELLSKENLGYEEERRQHERPKARKIAADTETLNRLQLNLKEKENIRRKLELEAKLYGKWRHGVDDENAIFESKSDHEVLAKLNWLDKQVDDQLQRERDEAIAAERRLRLQEELNKTEEVQKERQRIREQEIKEIRALEESHMEQLRQLQTDSEELKQQEHLIRSSMEELSKELQIVEENTTVALAPTELSQAYNLKKIKVYIRKRSEFFSKQIMLALSVLSRISEYCIKKGRLLQLQQKYEDQLEAEKGSLSKIELMYESEAKYSLQCCEDVWQSQQSQRNYELKQLIKDEQCTFAALLDDNLQRQTEIIETRSTHLNSIENANEKLKQLIKEQEESPRGSAPLETSEALLTASSADVNDPLISKSDEHLLSTSTKSSSTVLPKLTNSFTNLNLDVWKDLTPARGGIDSPRMQRQRDLRVVTSDTAERPKFARKRVAWS